MQVGDVLLYTLHHTLGYTPAEIRISCIQSNAVIVAARFSTLFHQLWLARVESLSTKLDFSSDEERHTYFLMNVDPCSCVLGYRSVTVKIDTLAIQTADGWMIALCDDILSQVFMTLTTEHPDVQYAGYVSYRWMGDDGERFSEFEISSGDNILADQTYGVVALSLVSALQNGDGIGVLKERLATANDVDRYVYGEALCGYQQWLHSSTYNRLVTLV